MCFPPLPYLIHLFTCDSVTDLCPSGAWIHIDRVSCLLWWAVPQEPPQELMILFLQSFSTPCTIKGAPIIACPHKTQTLQQKQVYPFLFNYSSRFRPPLGSAEWINATLSIFCPLGAAKARVSNGAIHLNTPKTLLKLHCVCFWGIYELCRCNFTNKHTAQGKQSCEERKEMFNLSLLPPGRHKFQDRSYVYLSRCSFQQNWCDAAKSDPK